MRPIAEENSTRTAVKLKTEYKTYTAISAIGEADITKLTQTIPMKTTGPITTTDFSDCGHDSRRSVALL
jgi:hypothetical protein